MKTNTLRICSWGLFAATLMLCFDSASAARGPRRSTAPDYTKGEKPASPHTKWAIGPTGAYGYFYYRNARQVLIENIDEGSPAHGTLREGDVILGILSPTEGQDTNNGKFAIEARHSMARAIEQAEKKEHGGKLTLNVWRPNGKVVTKISGGKYKKEVQVLVPDKPLTGKVMPVTLTLPVMGSYSATSPWNCEKTEALIEKSAKAIMIDEFYWINKKGSKNDLGIDMALEALGLLATGDQTYMPRIREFAQRRAGQGRNLDINSGEKNHNLGSWHAAYYSVFLCEYYLATGDKSVLSGIEGYANYLASGVSGVGTWSHGMANVRGNGMYGPPTAYGAMNQCSAVCAMSLVLAKKCGVENERVDKAIELAKNFFRFYVDKGVLPYGDHDPVGNFDENGRMSATALFFDLAGEKAEAEYFTKMVLASYTRREEGHTGHFFATQWGALAAARGGPEAAASFAKNTRYFTELERRHDGRCVYQPQLPEQSRKNYGYRTTGQRLQQYCLPLKKLYVTGKGGSCISPITGEELKKIVAAPFFDPRPLSTQELLAALGSELPPIREKAAVALGKRDDDVVDELIAMLNNPNRYARYGACEGLRYAGRGSAKAVDALIHKMENDKDMTLRYFAIEALKLLPENQRKDSNGLGKASKRATNALLKLAAEYDPELDPMRRLGRQISFVLFSLSDKAPGYFCGRRRSVHQDVLKVDKALLIPALKAMLANTNSEARGNAMRVARLLPREDLNQFWDDIYRATTNPAPSGVMFADQTHINGIAMMAEHKVKEGMQFGYWYVLKKNGWGFGGRKSHGGIDALLMYGRAMEPYFKDLEVGLNRFLKGASRQKAREKLKVARAQPMPELISIEKHIKSTPEKPYLDWKAKADKQKKEQPKKPQPEKANGPLPTAENARVFTDTEGRKITAKLQSVNGREITIKRKDGEVFTISLDLLSADDRAYAKDWKSKSAAK